jgi:hypothetical protein
VTAEFFDVLRLPIVRGRGFTTAEESAVAPVAVVSESVAAQLWPGRDAVGHGLWFPDEKTVSARVEVIGVVPDVPVVAGHISSSDVFVPFGRRFADDAVAVVVRGSGPSQAALDALRAAAQHSEPPLGFLTSRTVDDEFAGGVGPAKFLAGVSAMLGVVGLVMALAGLYGITAQLAAQRRKELGIRKALGATNLALCRMLAAEGTRILLTGVAPGIVCGLLLGFALRQRSFPNLEPLDWVALTAVSSLVVFTGLLGAVLPFRRVLQDQYAALREL